MLHSVPLIRDTKLLLLNYSQTRLRACHRLGLRICQWGQIGGQQGDDVVVVEGVIMAFFQNF